MSDATASGARTRVTKIIKAPRKDLYLAFLDAGALTAWLPPAGMSGDVHVFEPRVGGRIEMTLSYADTTQRGKTSAGTDTFRGWFAELIPHEKVVWTVEFLSADPAFAGEMRMIATFSDVPDGTEVAMTCENIPSGIRLEDNVMGTRSSLQNLARLIEQRAGRQKD